MSGLSFPNGRLRHQRIAKIAKEEEDKKKGQENIEKSKDEQKKLQEKKRRQKEANAEAHGAVIPCCRHWRASSRSRFRASSAGWHSASRTGSSCA